MERLRTIHEREGGNIGQVDLDQLSVVILQLGGIGQSGDLFDQLVRGRIAILAPVAVPVARHTDEFGAQQMADARPWLSRAGAVAPHHEDVIAGRKRRIRLGDDGLVHGPFGVVGRDVNPDLLAGGSNHFDRSLPVGPAVGAGGHVGELLAVVFTPAVAIGVLDPGIVEQFLGAFDVVAGPLQVLDGSLVVQGLFTSGRVHERARHLAEGSRLVGHGVGDDGGVVNGHGDGLADRKLVQPVGFQVVESGREAGADAVRRIGQVGGDGQPIVEPQNLNIGIELLAHIHFTLCQSNRTGRVVLEDRVRQVLRGRQLAPHALVLAPVLVITNIDNLRIVSEELVIGTGVDDVFSGISQQLRGIAADALFQLLGPGLLDDVVGAHVCIDDQWIDRLAVRAQLGLDHNRLGILGLDGVDEVLVRSTGGGAVLDMRGPGISDVIRGHRRAIAPLGGGLELEGDRGHAGIPGERAVSQQWIHLAVEHVVQVRGFEHGDAGAVLLRDRHGIVVAGGVRIPTNNRTPLLTIEVQGFIAGQSTGTRRLGRRRRRGHHDLLLDDLGLDLLDDLGLDDRLFDDLGLDDRLLDDLRCRCDTCRQ